MKYFSPLFICMAALVFFSGCGPSQTKDVSFTGSWTHFMASEVQGTREDTEIQVAADKDRFRIETTSRELGSAYQVHSIVVYDGTTIYRKSETISPNMEGDVEPYVSAEQPSKTEAASHRFWVTTNAPAAKTGPGGMIAGQDTMLYQARENRPDGKMTAQEWVDAQTGILLKKSLSVYSSQVEMEVMRETYECIQIQYGPVDEAMFRKPG